MFFKDFVSVKRKKIKKGASQTYDTPSLRRKKCIFATAKSFEKVAEQNKKSLEKRA